MSRSFPQSFSNLGRLVNFALAHNATVHAHFRGSIAEVSVVDADGKEIGEVYCKQFAAFNRQVGSLIKNLENVWVDLAP